MKKINGNIKGIRNSVLDTLSKLYEFKIEKGKIFDEELAQVVAKISANINREINLAVNRDGEIEFISIGDSSTVSLPSYNYRGILSGIRMIHTHPGGNPHLSSVDLSALILMRLDCIVSIGITENGITGYEIGFCNFLEDDKKCEKHFTKNIEEFDFLPKVNEIEKTLREKESIYKTESDKEYAILVGVSGKELLDELAELARACDIEVVGTFLQNKNKINPKFFISEGKVKELALKTQVCMANLIIFDDELSGLQIKNLEEITGTKTIDRTTLILDIFARRARTNQAKIQVELAQLKYRSNRLIGYGKSMSRLGGGVGTRGPGEKKLEIDKRRIRENISFLKNELEKERKIRINQRSKRENSDIDKISLVGYTNVGKSTLRNLLVKKFPVDGVIKNDVFAENMLFATLDTTTRTIMLPDKRIISLTDTVGFIRKIPHDLVESFKSTLEEVIFSDLILHVVDVSNDQVVEQIDAVEKVLDELGCKDKKQIVILNKYEIATEENIQKVREKINGIPNVLISAKEEKNIDELIKIISENINNEKFECELIIPYNRTDISSQIHKKAVVKNEEFLENGIKINAILQKREYETYKQFLVK